MRKATINGWMWKLSEVALNTVDGMTLAKLAPCAKLEKRCDYVKSYGCRVEECSVQLTKI